MKKLGRPKIENPKNSRLDLRLTKEQRKDLDDISSKTGLNKTEILLKGIKLVKEEIENGQN